MHHYTPNQRESEKVVGLLTYGSIPLLFGMSHLSYIVPPGPGETLRQKHWFSQAVRIGDRIEISGQSKNFYNLAP